VSTSGQSRRGELRSLEQAVAYRNRHVVDRFVERYPLPRDEAEDLFVETLRWLWLCARASTDERAPAVFIDDCMALLDEMWHTFVLFTQEYTDYCDANLGGYVHHAPTTVEDKQRTALERDRDPDGFREQKEVRLRALYEYVYDQLGEETLLKWYSTYPERYPPAFVQSILNPGPSTPTTENPNEQEGADRQARREEPPGQRTVLA